MSKFISLILSLIALVLFTSTNVLSHSETSPGKKAEVTVKPSDVLEKCVRIRPSETLHYSFKSSKPIMFNLHYHLVDNTIFHVKETATERKEVFKPIQGQSVYCMEWRNPLSVDVSLRYNYALDK